MNARKLFVVVSVSVCLFVSFALFSIPSKSQTIESQQWGPSVAGLQISLFAVDYRKDQFWSRDTSEFEVRLLPGKNQLSAEFEGGGARLVNLDMPGIKLMNFWTGKVQSNTLSIEK